MQNPRNLGSATTAFAQNVPICGAITDADTKSGVNDVTILRWGPLVSVLLCIFSPIKYTTLLRNHKFGGWLPCSQRFEQKSRFLYAWMCVRVCVRVCVCACVDCVKKYNFLFTRAAFRKKCVFRRHREIHRVSSLKSSTSSFNKKKR